MHIYKEIETSALLRMIPIQDAVNYYGDSEIIHVIGQDEILDTINEEDIANYLRKCGYKIEEPCEN